MIQAQRTSSRRVRTALTILRLLPFYLRFARLKTRVPLDELAQRAATSPGMHTPQPTEEARIVACVLRLHRLVGSRNDDCLPRSLLLFRELSRLGADPILSVGFREDGDRIAGHAWVEVRGTVVGEEDPAKTFMKTLTFSASTPSPCCRR